MLSDFHKNNKDDKIWWTERIELIDESKGFVPNNVSKVFGEHLFSFDKKKIYNLFRDYPYKLTKEEKEIFDKENPYWAEFFKWRSKK